MNKIVGLVILTFGLAGFHPVATAYDFETQMVDVGGYKLATRVMGSGSPAVIFDAGFGDNLAVWDMVQSEIADLTTTVSYDRAGLGESEVSPEPRTAKQISAELKTLLAESDIAPPYVVVGHSAGGMYMTVFASLYPEDIASLILVDPANSEMYDHMETTPEWTGVLQQLEAFPPGFRGQVEEQQTNKDQFDQAWPLSNVPVTLVTATSAIGAWPFATANDMKRWVQSHNHLLKESPTTRHVVVDVKNHGTVVTIGDELVGVIKREIDRIRSQ